MITNRTFVQWDKELVRFSRHPLRPDAVHALRAATRRCLAAMELLGIPEPTIKKLIHLLSKARDAEVVLETLSPYSHSSEAVSLFLRQLTAEKNRLLAPIRSQLRSKSFRRTRQQLHDVRIPKSWTKKERPASVLQHALHKVKTIWKHHHHSPKPDHLHRLRRAIRRLRFLAELMTPMGDASMGKLEKEAVHWQHQLGQYQDSRILQKAIRHLSDPVLKELRQRYKSMEHHKRIAFLRDWKKSGFKKLHHQAKKALTALS